MTQSDNPVIDSNTSVAEITLRGVILAIFLTIILAVSNAYLALKLGILTSASIPAAMISIGILRFFKGATILENNAVQTAASAGEAVAGGIVYTIPGLIVIGFWHSFDYFTNFFIALCGGVLGVLFSIPLRRILVHDRTLQFPEGRAIAEVLKSSVESRGLVNLVLGGMIGALLELLQVGFKVIASTFNYWFVVKRSLFCLGLGFSATMVGAGFLVGQDMATSLFIGAILAWVFALPIVSRFYPDFLMSHTPSEAGSFLWNSELRYIGIGAMLFAGIWTFMKLLRPLLKTIYDSIKKHKANKVTQLPRIERDIPISFILLGVFLMLAILFLLFQITFPLDQLGLPDAVHLHLIFSAVVYVLLFGFLFSIMTAYFSGMVGVSASPGSSVVITGVLLAALLLLGVMNKMLVIPFSEMQINAAEAITIIVGSIVTGIAAIANDNSQDLKVGQLVGATPWKQQLMLLLGVLISALVIPFVMQLMFTVYGIAGVMPHAGMDVTQSLPAPTAVLLAAVSEAVLRGNLPWGMVGIGAGMMMAIVLINHYVMLSRYVKISMLGVAIGMYLPLTSSFPLFVGGMIAFLVKQKLNQQSKQPAKTAHGMRLGMLIACGLVAGSAIMDVILAIVFSVLNGPDSLTIVSTSWTIPSVILGAISLFCLALWIRRVSSFINSRSIINK